MPWCHGEESLGEVAHASLETAPGVCGGAAGASILISLTAYKTKLHIWREIIPRENSHPAPSEAAFDVSAAWEWRSRKGHFPYHRWFARLPVAFFSASVSTALVPVQSAETNKMGKHHFFL